MYKLLYPSPRDTVIVMIDDRMIRAFGYDDDDRTLLKPKYVHWDLPLYTENSEAHRRRNSVLCVKCIGKQLKLYRFSGYDVLIGLGKYAITSADRFVYYATRRFSAPYNYYCKRNATVKRTFQYLWLRKTLKE